MCTVCLLYAICIIGMKFNGSKLFIVLFFETLLYVWENCMDVKVARLNTVRPRRNVSDFRRMFIMLKYTDITQNTYIQS